MMPPENPRECLCVGVSWLQAVLYGAKCDYKPEPHPECLVCKGTGVRDNAKE